jgi:hypothetical protein
MGLICPCQNNAQWRCSVWGSSDHIYARELVCFQLHRTLRLDYNNLNGSIPSAIGSSLTTIHLFSNLLTGGIPSSLGTAPSLRCDPTSAHCHTCSLRPLLVHSHSQRCSVLVRVCVVIDRELVLHTNKLGGTIPSTLGTQTQLTALDVSSNQLIGTVPTAAARFAPESWKINCLVNAMNPHPGCDLVEREFLVDLYGATAGAIWVSNTDWLSPGIHPCSWVGVLCAVPEGPVVAISLPGTYSTVFRAMHASLMSRTSC